MNRSNSTYNNPPLASSQLTIPQIMQIIKEVTEKRAAQPPRHLVMKPPLATYPSTSLEIINDEELHPITCGIPFCNLWRRIINHN